MSHAGHETVKCSCGVVISQCRCMSPDKRIVVRVAGCPKCKEEMAKTEMKP